MTYAIDWWKLGFRTPPRLVVGAGETVYRTWDDVGSRRRGVFFTRRRPHTREEAERQLAVMEYGNACHYLSAFRLTAGLELWEGEVHSGDPRAVLGRVGGSQLYAPRTVVPQMTLLWTIRLPDPPGEARVVVRPRPGARSH